MKGISWQTGWRQSIFQEIQEKSQLCLCVWRIMCTPERRVRVMNTRFGVCRWSAGGFMSAGRVSAALAASPSSCQPLSHGSHRRPRPSQHLNSITLLQHFPINICTSFLMPFHDSKRAARNPSACLTHYSGIFHYTAMIFHRCRTRDLMRGCHANSSPMNLQTNSPSASRSTNHAGDKPRSASTWQSRRPGGLQTNTLECSTCLSCVLLL